MISSPDIRKVAPQPASNPRLRRQGPEPNSLRRKPWATGLAIVIFLSAPDFASAQARKNASPAEVCLAANPHLSLGVTLPRTKARIKSGGLLTVVAIGSSSTVGLWVLSSADTYPAVMQKELMRLVPNVRIMLINSGKIGDTIPDNIARIERDVLFHRPDLVIWQLGTNDVAWGGDADGLDDLVIRGVETLKSGGSDLILMDQQYAPQVLSSSRYSKMQAIIADAALSEHVGLFSRFDLMRNSVEAGLSMGALVSWDGLHNSIEGYDCVGRALARAIWSAMR